MNVPTQLLSKCEEETLAHLRCPQFCFACNLRVYHRESLLAGTFACTFLLVRRHPAGSSVENKFTFGKRFLSFLVSLIWISVTLQIRPWERRDKIDFGDIISKYPTIEGNNLAIFQVISLMLSQVIFAFFFFGLINCINHQQVCSCI